MIARILAVVLALSASPAFAQTVPVQSGDHPGFTRLVLPIGADRDWELDPQSETNWTLTVSPPVDRFDLSGAFDLIQRARLLGLTGDTSLSLELACACDVNSFRFNERFLVIDISDPDPNAPPPVAAIDILPEGAAQRATAASALPDLANLLGTPTNLPDVPNRPWPESGEADLAPDPTPISEAAAAADPNPRLAEAAEIMAEQLARAAASGLLDASLGQPMTMGDPTHVPSPEREEVTEPQLPEADMAVAAQAPPEDVHTPGTHFPSGSLPIRAETAFDTAIQLHLPIGPPREEAACDGIPFDVRDWASGNGFDYELGELRAELFDERDVLVPAAVIHMAQHYLYYGFGAEADYWLSQLADTPEALLHVAALIDGGTTAPFRTVDTPEACSQGELLWRYLAGSVEGDLTSNDTSALQRAFGDLPSSLRDQMGPRLARQLARDGYAGTARNVRDALNRGGRIDVSALRLLDLDLGINQGETHEETRTALAETLRDDGGDPVSVMAHALAFDRSIGERPLSSRLVAAEAMLRENGDGPTTEDLWHEVLLGHAALGQIDRALNMLDDPSRVGEAHARALTDLIAERVLVGDTAALVILAYTHGADWRPEGSAAGRFRFRPLQRSAKRGCLKRPRSYAMSGAR